MKPLVVALLLASPWVSGRVYAACTPANPAAGATVTCSGAANPLAPSYSTAANNLTVNVLPGASTGVLLGLGGTAMRLTGNNTTLNNSGTIDPSLLGLLSLLSSGTVVGNSAASTVNIVNASTGVMNGTSGLLGVSINGLTGMALAAQNGTGGTTNIRNDGAIGGAALLGVTLVPSDIPVVAAYGGGQVNFVNTGTINGRIGFEASGTPGAGNTFANAGTINGGVSMGIDSTNTFTAVSGSSVNLAGGIGLSLDVLGLVGVTLGFAPTGVVDGGAGGSNTLVLQNVLPSSGTGSGTGGVVTTLSSGTYINFQHLLVNSGTWNLQGPLVSGDATLNGGLVNFNNGGVFGSGAVSANGGAIGASAAGITLANDFTLGTGGLITTGSGSFVLSGTLSGTGGLTKLGAGTLTLTGPNSYTGVTAIDAGVLALGAGSSIAASSGVALASGGALDLSAAGNQTLGLLSGAAGSVNLGANTLMLNGSGSGTFGGVLSGSGALVMDGTGTQTLTGANLYSGGTTIQSGTLAVGAGGSLASGTPVTVNGGTFDLSAAGDQTIAQLEGTGGQVQLGGGSTLTLAGGSYAGNIAGSGGLVKTGTGTLSLDGNNSYSGPTQVVSGGMLIGSDAAHSSAGVQSDITVASTGSLGGFGHVDGNVDVLAGGHLAPGAPAGVFTVNGNLIMEQGSQLDAQFGAPGPDFNTPGVGHSTQVNGDLTLNGAMVNPVDAGGFGPGLYNLFNYTGSLTQAGGGITAPTGYAIQNLVGTKKINLVNALGIDLNIWNANGLAGPTQMGGGSGVWSQANANWTDATGSLTALRSPADAFVIFGGAAGVVTVDDAGGAQPVTTQGIQFANDGYRLDGDALGLVAPSAGAYSELRVGDGSAASTGWTATIDNVLTGNGIQKTGAGTLVLNGTNTYTGGTQLAEGTLSLSSDANLGDPGNAIDFEGGILQVSGTAYNGTPRAIVFGPAGGGFDIADAANTFTVTQPLAGTGALTKLGDGTLVLTGTNTYSGGTTVNDGTLILGAGGSLAAGSGVTVNGNGVLDVSAAGSQTFGTLDGDGQVQLGGATLAVGAGTYGGTIVGGGGVDKTGSGTLTLNGIDTYSGPTQVLGGTLLVGDATHATASVQSDIIVASTGVLGGFGSVNGNVDVQAGGHLAPGNPTGSFNVNGNLLAEQGSQFDFWFGTPGPDSTTPGQGHNVQVNGDLTLDGATLVPYDAGGFGPGLYNLFNYTGSLTQANGGIIPPSSGYTIQYLTGSKQVNLVASAGMALNFWNANGLASSTQLGGGSGTWAQANANWANADGSATGVRVPANAFAIFAGAPGTVTVDDAGGALPVTTLGIQFASDGYLLDGDTLTLDGSTQHPLSEIRVGDGSAASAGWVATIDSTLSGAGIDKTGLGTLVLNGANTYTQSTQISQGTLSVSSDASLGAPTAGIDIEGGTLQVTGTAFSGTTRAITLGATGGGLDIADAGNTFTLSQALSGSGGVTKLGAGTLVLTGANTYGGGTIVNAGTLAGNSTSLRGAIADNGVLVFDQATDGIFQGNVTGAGQLIKTGQGALTLNDLNAFTGATSVEQGTLQVGDTSTSAATLGGDVAVGSGGTLTGQGTIDGSLINDGVLHPGGTGAVGVLNVNDNYTQGVDGTFAVTLAANGAGSQLMVNGSATLAGSALLFLPSAGWQPGTGYRILTATGGVSGEFGSVASNFAFVTPTLSYDATSVSVLLARNANTFPSVAETANGRAVAEATEALGPGNPLFDLVVVLDRTTAAAAFQQLQADIHASTRTALLDSDRYVREAINAHLAGTSSRAGTHEAADRDGGSVWTSAWGHWGRYDSDGNASELSANGSGIVVGTDTSVGSDARVGGLLGRGQGTARSTTPAVSAHHVDNYAGLYADMRSDAFHLQAAAIYGWQKVRTRRSIAFADFRSTTSARYDANTAQAYVDGSYEIGMGRSTLAPFVNIAYDRLTTDAIKERDSIAAFEVKGQSSSVTVGTLGARGSLQLGDRGDIRATFSLGWQHAWGDVTPVETMRFAAGGPSFNIGGVPVARNAAAVNGGISFAVAPGVAIDATYSGQFAGDVKDQAARVALAWAF
ncbi:autotransporter-associated beta strand repeat-containing protein [Luteibacter yeojuensis]|uniref:autotransporter-associated beta strand repeat-containing protein n=1 Tax=Luteibacter yeojuensis TaxID=345309 RepID=UPI001F03E5DC|nr:autotransporter-associated beta strand repeat-containing protein [Luteibacter yeojuensis]